jgi:hypothetical protein
MRITQALVIVAAFGVAAQEPPTLRAERNRIAIGESTTITWSSGGRPAFLIGIGKVPTSGTRNVSPIVQTTYVLLVENGATIDHASVTVDVTGARGDLDFPDVREFTTNAVTGQVQGVSYTDYLDAVHRTLQDKMGFYVRGDFLPRRPNVILFTNRRLRPDLVRQQDRGIRHRRIAFAVDVTPIDKAVSFQIRALLDYQRTAENNWRAEPDLQMSRDAAESLRSTIELGVKR